MVQSSFDALSTFFIVLMVHKIWYNFCIFCFGRKQTKTYIYIYIYIYIYMYVL